MTDKEAYKHLQASWIKLYNVKVGDTVRILRDMCSDELGCKGHKSLEIRGLERKIDKIGPDYIHLEEGGYWPFFCLELVKKAEPETEITYKVSIKVEPLSALSEETISNLRKLL